MIYLQACIMLTNLVSLVVWRKYYVGFLGWNALANAICVLSEGITHSWEFMLFNGVCGIISFVMWWRRRRDKRRRAAALIGAKSRALRDSLVRRMAEETAKA